MASNKCTHTVFSRSFQSREAKGMNAIVHLLSQGTQLKGGELAREGVDAVLAASGLLQAVLEAAGHLAARAFAESSGFWALRMCIASAQLGDQHAAEVSI